MSFTAAMTKLSPFAYRGFVRENPRALLLAFALVTLPAQRAGAEAAPDRYRSAGYYSIHAGATLLLSATAILAQEARGIGPGRDSDFFPGDLSVRENYSHSAAVTSDISLSLALANPIAAQLGLGVGAHSLNAGLVYGQTLALNLALNSVTKVLVERPRPSTYRLRSAGIAPALEWYVSFYSGHASTAFAAAMSGSYLFAENTGDREARYLLWGAELGLAAATATLRVRAGKHYYSDVVVGALVGTAVGIGVPLIHGARYEPEVFEYVAGGAGFVLGTAASTLLSFALDPVTPSSTARSWSIHPSSTGLGFSISGTLR